MLVKPYVHQEWHLLKWLALLALASAFAVGVASKVLGGDQPRRLIREPHLLPEAIAQWSSPMEEPDGAWVDWPQATWDLLKLHREQQYEQVIPLWRQVPLPEETRVWKDVALAQAYLATGEIEAAAVRLQAALEARPGNAVAVAIVMEHPSLFDKRARATEQPGGR